MSAICNLKSVSLSLLIVAGAFVCAATIPAQTPATAPLLEFGQPVQVGQIKDSAVVPPSGIVASRQHPGVLYFQEDAGGKARFFALDPTGKTLGEYVLTGATNVDWEDIAVGPSPAGKGQYVFIGDFGDNAARMGRGSTRNQILVYRVPEPEIEVPASQPAATAPVTAASQGGPHALADWKVLRFTYPDGPHDAETLMVDPVTSDILIVTKESNGNSGVYRAAGNTPADKPTVLEKIANIQFATSGQGAQATAGDISPTGDRVIIRTYTAILIWVREPGPTLAATFAKPPKTLPSPNERQGEGLTFSADGRSWYSAGEGSPAIYQGKAIVP
jgi:hypothetical protein